jgi:hypothetical protein
VLGLPPVADTARPAVGVPELTWPSPPCSLPEIAAGDNVTGSRVRPLGAGNFDADIGVVLIPYGGDGSATDSCGKALGRQEDLGQRSSKLKGFDHGDPLENNLDEDFSIAHGGHCC